ncbi:hypothetical protein BU25DRAFT_338913, partial [Macroventuria anomochaeta]
WPDVEERLGREGDKMRLSLELNAKSVAAAVDISIQQKVDQLAQEKQYRAEVRSAVLQHLTSNANGTFPWVSLICLDLKATQKWNVLKRLVLLPPGLGSLYRRIMHQICESDSAEICQQVLASTAVLYRPDTISELVALVEPLEDLADGLESVREIIGLYGLFLTVREDTIYFMHQSAQDFLFAKEFDEVFPHGIEAVHKAMFVRSLAILSKTLYRDMYCLEALGTHIDNVQPPRPDSLAASRYPCVYWIDHLCHSKHESQANGVGDPQFMVISNEFLETKYLSWLERLSLCKGMGKGMVSMEKLWALAKETRDADKLTNLFQDARQVIMYHKGAIESYPLQAYASALLFSPTGSAIRRLFQQEEPKGIIVKPAMSSGWSACLQMLEGHSNRVSSVAFSHDSTKLALASFDKTIKLWDASSGACLQTLKIGKPLYNLSFNSTNSFLCTEIGTIAICCGCQHLLRYRSHISPDPHICNGSKLARFKTCIYRRLLAR